MTKIRDNWFKVIFLVDNPYTHRYKKGEIYWGHSFENRFYLCMTLDGKLIGSCGYKITELMPLMDYRDNRINEILNIF